MKGILFLCLALFLLVAPAAPAATAGPRVGELSIVIAGGQVLVSFELEGGFTPELTQRMESGLPTGFVYELELSRARQWWDASVDSLYACSTISVPALISARNVAFSRTMLA